MDLKNVSKYVLVEMKESLEHARDNRQGGLLHGEKVALRRIIRELDRREGNKGRRKKLGYSLGEYPVIVRVFPNRRGKNFFKWLWARTNLFQRIRIGIFEPCRLGYCAVDKSHYDGGDAWVMDMLRNGLCPHCGNPTQEKYLQS